MRKYTQKELKNLIAIGVAEDITNADNDDRKRILAAEGNYAQIGYSAGVYGCNGKLLQGAKTGKLYAIAGRTTATYIF